MKKISILLSLTLSCLMMQAEDIVSVATISFSDAQQGIVNGNALFTVNASGKQVYFSKGNLQYQDKTGTFRFADHQYDCIPADADANKGSLGQEAWMDLFYWGSSNIQVGKKTWNPASAIPSYLNSSTMILGNLNIDTTNYEWGRNPIANGGNEANVWRTMTKQEWTYLLANHVYMFAEIKYSDGRTYHGLVLVPDDYKGTVKLPEIGYVPYPDRYDKFTGDEWTQMEMGGCVLLPCEGYIQLDKSGAASILTNRTGAYWTTTGYEKPEPAYEWSPTALDNQYAQSYELWINCRTSQFAVKTTTTLYRATRCSVRLVVDKK